MTPDLLIYMLPFGLIIAWLLLAPAPLAPATRPTSTSTMLTTLLFSFIASILIIRLNAHADALTASRLLAATLTLLGTGLAIAPLLDRARPTGLLLGASIAGIFTVPLVFHGFINKLPHVSGIAVLYAVLIAGSITGLYGSKKLLPHAQRFTETGMRRAYAIFAPRLAFGWFILAIILIALAGLMSAPDVTLPVPALLICGFTAALVTLIQTRAHDSLQKACEGFAAGGILALGSSMPLELSLLGGLAAGICVLRTEAMARALKLDDPQHLMGVILLPASLGLLTPGVTNWALFTPYALWLFASIALGFFMAMIVWPLTKLTVGLAAPH